MEDVLAIRDEYRLQEWSQIIQAGQNSGQSVLAWCKEHGICSQTYYKWQNWLFTMAEGKCSIITRISKAG